MIGICDICRYGQTDKCTHPDRGNPRECFTSYTGTTIAEKQIRSDVLNELMDIRIELGLVNDESITKLFGKYEQLHR